MSAVPVSPARLDLDGGGVRTDHNLAYATLSDAQRLDLSLPSGAGDPLPVVVAIHGGAFAFGDKQDMARTAHALTAAGYAVASVNYRLSGEAAFPAAVADVRAAVRWLRANAHHRGLDPTRIGVIGESAGGYLAAMLGAAGADPLSEDVDLPPAGDLSPAGDPPSSAVGAVVDLYGPVDFSTMDTQLRANPRCPARAASHDRADSPESRFLGAQITTAPELVRRASPLSHLRPDRPPPPFLIEHGDTDCTVPYQQSQQLADGLCAVGGSVELTLLRGAGHGGAFPLAERLPGIIRFLDRVLDRAPR
ncbi:alpha/beta hydrolase [Parafrankia discariae]|uniref:alpha/beta hydrolase n=1 Tax=Parafrankia discariae TaxID=365528 RepID=UPI00036DA8D2|nr:alpha/beta hydrolase [Parafrankia discariae]